MIHKHRLAESTVTKVPSWHFGSAGGAEGAPSSPDSGGYCLHCTTQGLGLVPVNCSTKLLKGALNQEVFLDAERSRVFKTQLILLQLGKKIFFLKTQHAVQRHPTSDGFTLWEAIWPLLCNSLLLRNI